LLVHADVFAAEELYVPQAQYEHVHVPVDVEYRPAGQAMQAEAPLFE
jgi:hypothetical protein